MTRQQIFPTSMRWIWKTTHPIFTKFYFAQFQPYLHIISKFQLKRSKTERLVLITKSEHIYLVVKQYPPFLRKVGKSTYITGKLNMRVPEKLVIINDITVDGKVGISSFIIRIISSLNLAFSDYDRFQSEFSS